MSFFGLMWIDISVFLNLTFFATKSTTSRATPKQPAAILAVRRFVDASINVIPQNEEPRSGCKEKFMD